MDKVWLRLSLSLSFSLQYTKKDERKNCAWALTTKFQLAVSEIKLYAK